ncbi:MAG: PHP domain-containing protein [Deltaproteobacteria bacterium]|nr:PHP domain-containing protein [Deltaproteobacteria bacterium]MBW2017557.1 PHP domain-containing protein [Deltaproteobacteria bacterium]MBW2128704.1 PHP domain-containing protein [Deltaproteobacteria bacterium]MBW2302414.1 PHP domain-containing protein [Deltaproteobacteria bacterium]
MLRFMRNKLVTVTREGEGSLKVHGVLEDDIYGLELDLSVGIPQMEILAIKGRWTRWTTPECHRAIPLLEGAVGFRIMEEGFKGRVQKVIGRKACRHFANLLLECCHCAREAVGQAGGDPVEEKAGETSESSGGADSGTLEGGVPGTVSPGKTLKDTVGGTIIDLHVHTAQGSPCSSASVDALIEEARRIGLDGICLTDHNHLWRAEECEALSRKHGFMVLRGNEITTEQGDILVFGLDEDIRGLITLEALREKVREAGGFMVAAHPFRGFLVFGAGDLGLTPEEAGKRRLFQFVDALETLNGKVTERENALASRVAEVIGLPVTGGSDAHEVEEVGLYATRFGRSIRNEKDLVRALREGDFSPVAYRKGLAAACKA